MALRPLIVLVTKSLVEKFAFDDTSQFNSIQLLHNCTLDLIRNCSSHSVFLADMDRGANTLFDISGLVKHETSASDDKSP